MYLFVLCELVAHWEYEVKGKVAVLGQVVTQNEVCKTLQKTVYSLLALCMSGVCG